MVAVNFTIWSTVEVAGKKVSFVTVVVLLTTCCKIEELPGAKFVSPR
jgi:hypothetical protein